MQIELSRVVHTACHTRDRQLMQLMTRLDSTQWLSEHDLEQLQLKHLRSVLAHHVKHSPWAAERISQDGRGLREITTSLEAWAQFPVMTRRDIQDQCASGRFLANHVPSSHLPCIEKKSSGSTGEPVRVVRTAISQLFWQAMTMRDHFWHRRESEATLAAVRTNFSEPVSETNWGAPVSRFFATGPFVGMPSNTDVPKLLEWLLETKPGYLLIYPSILQAVLDLARVQQRSLPSVFQVRTIGETLGEELRHRCREQMDTDIADLYSAEEVGVVALQCPESSLYHTMAESIVVEVLRPDGSPCLPGEVGRVVLTDLHNYASPILRYENGDYAEVGEQCTCGRHLPTLRRIVGRERNMVRLPNGQCYWPTTGFREFSKVAAVRQYQFIQHSLDCIEVRLVVDEGELSEEQELALSAVITRWIGHPFSYRFVYFEQSIPRHASGKFEEFICLCDNQTALTPYSS